MLDPRAITCAANACAPQRHCVTATKLVSTDCNVQGSTVVCQNAMAPEAEPLEAESELTAGEEKVRKVRESALI